MLLFLSTCAGCFLFHMCCFFCCAALPYTDHAAGVSSPILERVFFYKLIGVILQSKGLVLFGCDIFVHGRPVLHTAMVLPD